MARFLSEGIYNTWQPAETHPHRIDTVLDMDPNLNVNPAPPNPQQHRDNLLNKRRRQLKTFLSQVAKCVSENHYTTVMRQATSLEWITPKYGRITIS